MIVVAEYVAPFFSGVLRPRPAYKKDIGAGTRDRGVDNNESI